MVAIHLFIKPKAFLILFIISFWFEIEVIQFFQNLIIYVSGICFVLHSLFDGISEKAEG